MLFDEVCRILKEFQISISPQQKKSLLAYHSTLLEWNTKVNLISRKHESLFWEQHLLHSLSLLAYFPIAQGASVCDFGTGGGLPGLPIAIVRPDLQMTLLDSIQKKTTVLKDILRTLHLQGLGLLNVQVASGRGEDLGRQSQYARKFDVILARAVSSLSNIELWTRHLRKPHSTIYAYKGGDLSQEIRELRQQTSRFKTIQEQSIEFAMFAESDKKIVALHF